MRTLSLSKGIRKVFRKQALREAINENARGLQGFGLPSLSISAHGILAFIMEPRKAGPDLLPGIQDTALEGASMPCAGRLLDNKRLNEVAAKILNESCFGCSTSPSNQGSGFVIGDKSGFHIIMTCGHLVYSASSIYLDRGFRDMSARTIVSNMYCPGDLNRFMTDFALAVLPCSADLELVPVTTARALPQNGEPGLIISGFWESCSEGVFRTEGDYVYLDRARDQGGSSGSPMFAVFDDRLAVVGVHNSDGPKGAILTPRVREELILALQGADRSKYEVMGTTEEQAVVLDFLQDWQVVDTL